MLALSRKKDESIIIDSNIEIVVLDISGDQVKLGIRAPKHISIHRKEIYLQIQQENTMAAKVPLTEEKLVELKNKLKKI
ncbi:carbon storage regulator CsrA [Vallitalea okinawensis]|uniref:carbon storage regulator CsrA n=1 Tax=Vallitalea okinawensis TaxID=2078660 RepID=UPI000CFB4AD2|nr:carbon storage regulator CsrA [Vallitalea okinawensis]